MAPAKATKKGTTNPSKSTGKKESPKRTSRRAKKNKHTYPFPFKLRDILRGDNKHIIDWDKDGKIFVIKDHRAFETEIIPKFGFKSKDLRNFTRNFSAWKFDNCSGPTIAVTSPGGCAWRHRHFYKGVPDRVLASMKRTLQTSKKSSSSSFSASSEDDDMDLDNNEESIERIDSMEEEAETEEEAEETEDDDEDDDDDDEACVPLETTLQREDSMFGGTNNNVMFAIHQSDDELPADESQVEQPTRPSFMRRHLENL